MFLLTNENKSFDTTLINTDNTCNYCILDYSNQDDVDYFFPKIVMYSEFSDIPVELKIGRYRLEVPLSWRILVGEFNSDYELMPIVDLIKGDYKAVIYNPLSSFMVDYIPVCVNNIYTKDVKWYIPSTKKRNLILSPMISGERPPCILLSEECHDKDSGIIDVNYIVN